MKATPASSLSKTRVNTVHSKTESPRNSCELFLGNKVLSELRILMRLATPSASTPNGNTTGSSGHSY